MNITIRTLKNRVHMMLALVLLPTLILTACSRTVATSQPATAVPTAAPTEQKEPYKIGITLGLSGQYSGPGVEIRDAIVMEVERINAAGGIDGHLIELVIEDDGMDPTRATTNLTKLIRQDKVIAVIGPFGSSLEGAVRPVTEREQVTQILPAPTNAEFRAVGYKWSFNIAPNEIIAAEAISEILAMESYTRVAAVTGAGPLYELMVKQLESAGTKVFILPDTISPRDVDMTPQATKLKELATKENVQAVLVLADGFSSTMFIKAMRQLAIDLPVVGSHAMAAPLIFSVAGDEVDGLLLPGPKNVVTDELPDSDPQKAVILDFFSRFQTAYGKPPLSGGTLGFDAINMLVDAIRVAGGDRAKIRDALEHTTGFVGTTGVFTYTPADHEGLSRDSLAILKVDMKNKKFVLVQPSQ